MNKNAQLQPQSPIFFKWTFKSIFEWVLVVLLFGVLLLEGCKFKAVSNSLFIDQKVQLETPLLLDLVKQNREYPKDTYSVFSHGRSGQLYIEGAWLDAPEISQFLKERLGTAKNLHIYGCEFAKGKKGKAAVAYLQQTLGVEIAASTNNTGQHGDWVLEMQTKNQTAKNLSFPALNISLQDTDNDGVDDAVDIDDDNDGVIDTVECDFSNIALNKSAYAQSVRNDRSPNLAVDGDTSVTNYWGGNLPNWWHVDLENPHVINSFRVVHYYGTSRYYQYHIEASLDGEHWIQIAAKTDTELSTSAGVTFEVSGVSARYLRVHTTVASANNYAHIVEFEAFGYRDTDGDGVPNHLDLDSDNDGIPDNIEAQTTLGYIAPSGGGSNMTDTNNNGLDDVYETIQGGTDIVPINTDTGNDSLADYLDSDSDADGVPDTNEAGLTINGSVGINGLDATIDNGDTYADVNGIYDTSQTDNFADLDADVSTGGDVDWRDVDQTGVGIDTDGDGVLDNVDIDDDNDGIIDTVDGCDTGSTESNLSFIAVAGGGFTYNANSISFTNGSTGGYTNSVHSPAFLSYGASTDFEVNFTLEGTFSNVNERRVLLGINEVGTNVTASYTDIDYAFYIRENTYDVTLYENGVGYVQVGAATDGTKLALKKTGTQVTYWVNDVLVYTSSSPANGTDYFVDSSFYGQTSSFNLNNFVLIKTTAASDTDGDGILNCLDVDSDNDDIPDNMEAQTALGYVALTETDTDVDGLDDAYDADNGGLAINPVNTDGTDALDFLDLDSDNDGIKDEVEAFVGDESDLFFTTVAGSGFTLTESTNRIYFNNGGTGYVNSIHSADLSTYGASDDFEINFRITGTYLYSSSGRRVFIGINESGTNATAGYTDIDYAFYIHKSTEAPSIYENGVNIGSAGGNPAANWTKLAIKKTGTVVTYWVNDALVYTSTTPANGTDYYVDTSFRGPSSGVTLRSFNFVKNPMSNDVDLDGVLNYLDLDSDNDGIPDAIEAQATIGYIPPIGTDTDGDGLDDAYDTDNGGSLIIPINSDGTEGADFLDVDADDDGVFDLLESGGGLTDGNADGMTDGAVGNNGLDNVLDITDNYVNVRGVFDTTQADNFTDTDADVFTFGDVDYRDVFLSGTAMITQMYQSATDAWIEITNVHASNSIEANAIRLNVFTDSAGDQTGNSPSASYTYSAALAPGASVLLHNSTASITNTHAGAVLISDNAMTSFAGANDMYVLSSKTNSLAYERRYEEVFGIGDNSSYVRNDAVLTPDKDFNLGQWTVFVDDGLDPDADPPERHVLAPLLSEIATANTAANIQLGVHRIGATTRTGSVWDSGFPDRSRQVIVAEDLEQSSRLNAKNLQLNLGANLTINNNVLVVTDSIVNNGTLRMAGTSQLVQTHANTTEVSGSGNLQIDQLGTLASIYRFNYWSAPVVENGSVTYRIGTVLKDGTVPTSYNSEITAINFIGGYDGAKTSPISIASYWLYSYTNGAWNATGNTGVLNRGDGYLLKGPGVVQNYTFVGSPNDGLITTAIGASTSKLIGNPYPSALDATKFIRDNSDVIDGTLYFWEHTGELGTTGTQGHNSGGYLGGYSTRNLTMGIAANTGVVGTGGLGNATYRAPGLDIAVAQGFFVGGSEVGGTIVFNNAQRKYQTINGSNSLFFKGRPKVSKKTALPIVKLGLDYTNTEAQALHRQIGISFKEGNTFGYESGYDSEIYDLNTQDDDMYWNFGEEKNYVIAGVEAFNIAVEIPISLQIKSENSVTIRLDAFENIQGPICLFDALTNTFTDLKKSSGVQLNLAKGIYSNRFYLSFKEATLEVEDFKKVPDVQLYYSKATNSLCLQAKNEILKKITLFNIMGQQCKQWILKPTGEKKLALIVREIPMGVYMVKVETSVQTVSKKLIIY